MHIHPAHMAAGRHAGFRRTLTWFARIILVLPLAALWLGLGLSMIVAIVFSWYAAGHMLIGLI